MYVVITARNLIRQLAGAVRRIVVGDENMSVRNRLTGPADDACDVLRLVVGRDDHQSRSQWCGVGCLCFHFVLGHWRRCRLAQRESLSRSSAWSGARALLHEI